MAHELQSNDTLVLATKSAWHGLGIVLPDEFTVAEALSVGRLDWSVEESTALTATFVEREGEATRSLIETHKTLRRSDDKTILSTVGSDYTVLQNTALADIASSLGTEGGVKVESAGSLFGGRKVFFLIRTKTVDVGLKGDIVQQYILLANAHDGTMSATVMPTKIRVVCANTFTRALNHRSAAKAFRWRHTAGLALKTEDIKAALASYSATAADDAAAMNALAAKSLTSAQIQSLWTDVLVALDGPIAIDPVNDQQARRKVKAVEALANMARVFDSEAAQFGPTAWVAVNAATNYIQYHRGANTGDARVNSDLFGAYSDAKHVAMELALASL